jgi:hypothetical protein
LQFLLSDGLEATIDDNAVAETLRTSERCLEFLGRLEDHAGRLGMRKGALSRLLLPFDLNTDAGFQANTAQTAPLGSRDLNGLLPDDERRRLVTDAIALRQLIRVKLADCADIEQARMALELLIDFTRSLQGIAAEQGCSTAAILREL